MIGINENIEELKTGFNSITHILMIITITSHILRATQLPYITLNIKVLYFNSFICIHWLLVDSPKCMG